MTKEVRDKISKSIIANAADSNSLMTAEQADLLFFEICPPPYAEDFDERINSPLLAAAADAVIAIAEREKLK